MVRPAALSALLALSLSACVTAGGEVAGAEPATPPAEGCNADAARGAIGKTASADVVEQARKAAGAQIARTLRPGQIVTMEYHPSRLNLDVDANNVVTNVRCG